MTYPRFISQVLMSQLVQRYFTTLQKKDDSPKPVRRGLQTLSSEVRLLASSAQTPGLNMTGVTDRTVWHDTLATPQPSSYATSVFTQPSGSSLNMQ